MSKTAQSRSSQSETRNSPGGGKTAAELVRQSNRWRDNYNALRGLVIARVVTILEAAERGDFAELQLTMRKIERRYPVLKGLVARLLSSVEKLDWDIKTVDELPEGATEPMAEAQLKFLRGRYELVENLTEAFGQLALADFRGFAILQKHRYRGGEHDGAVREFHWLPQYCFSRDGQFGSFYYNQDSRFGIGLDSCKAVLGETNQIGGAELPREDFIIREHELPLYEIALIAFVNWSMGRKDWAAFVEIFGLPNSIIIMPSNIPAGKEAEFQSAAEQVANGVSGALPYGSDAKFPTASVRSQAPFKEFCDANDADVVLAGTGGRLSMLTSDKGGLGDGPSEEHADAFDDIAQALARKINLTLQRDFDRLELQTEFPGQPVLAYFELAPVSEEDAKSVVDRVVALEGAGYETDEEEVSEKSNLKVTRKQGASGILPEDPIHQGKDGTAGGTPDTTLKNRDSSLPLSAFLSAVAADLAPIRERLARIFQISDPDILKAKLAAFNAELPRLLKDINADPESARVLGGMMAGAMADGLTSKGTK